VVRHSLPRRHNVDPGERETALNYLTVPTIVIHICKPPKPSTMEQCTGHKVLATKSMLHCSFRWLGRGGATRRELALFPPAPHAHR
jgi:hypothetical protein